MGLAGSSNKHEYKPLLVDEDTKLLHSKVSTIWYNNTLLDVDLHVADVLHEGLPYSYAKILEIMSDVKPWSIYTDYIYISRDDQLGDNRAVRELLGFGMEVNLDLPRWSVDDYAKTIELIKKISEYHLKYVLSESYSELKEAPLPELVLHWMNDCLSHAPVDSLCKKQLPDFTSAERDGGISFLSILLRLIPDSCVDIETRDFKNTSPRENAEYFLECLDHISFKHDLTYEDIWHFDEFCVLTLCSALLGFCKLHGKEPLPEPQFANINVCTGFKLYFFG